MKKAMLLATAVLLFAGSALAELPPVGYIGIYADGARASNTVCPILYGQFQAWIWCLPSENGLQAAVFAVSFPATTVTLVTVKNPSIAVELGTLAGGISAALAEGSCQMDWVWLYSLTMMSMAPPTVTGRIDIIPHPGIQPVPEDQFASCLPGYPIESVINLTPLYICQEGPLGVQETNWGAIKSLF